MLKAFTQRISDHLEGQNGLDPETVARAFGAVIPITTPRAAIHSSSVPAVETAPSGVVPSKEGVTAMTLLGQLIATKPDTEALIDRKQWLIANLTPLLQEVDEFVSCVTEKRRQHLSDALIEIRAKCRTAERFAGLKLRDLKDAELRLHQVAARQEEALTVVRNMKNEEAQGRAFSRWASPAEIAKWHASVEAAQEQVTRMNREAVAALNERNEMASLVDPAQRQLEVLANEEIRLRHELDGKEFFDNETGLSSKIAGHVTA